VAKRTIDSGLLSLAALAIGVGLAYAGCFLPDYAKEGDDATSSGAPAGPVPVRARAQPVRVAPGPRAARPREAPVPGAAAAERAASSSGARGPAEGRHATRLPRHRRWGCA
jgi:hypothetical protein